MTSTASEDSPSREIEASPPKRYAEVAVPVPLRRTFHYALPEDVENRLSLGSRVLVPFGNKLLTGVVLDLTVEPGVEAEKVKPILDVLDEVVLLTPPLLRMARWVADAYLAPIGETLRVFFPPGLEVASVLLVQLTPMGWSVLRESPETLSAPRREILQLIQERGTTTLRYLQKATRNKSIHSLLSGLRASGWIEMHQKTAKARVREKRVQVVHLSSVGLEMLQEVAPDSRAGGSRRVATPKQRKALQYLADFRPPVLAASLRRETGVGAATLKAMAQREWIRLEEKVYQRRPVEWDAGASPPVFQLTAEQTAAVETIFRALAAETRKPLLLHGITGSGKTEIYIRAVRRVLDTGGQALVLVPEIGLTPAALQRFRSHFQQRVALLHSGLSEGERFDEWMRVRRGEADVVVGTRSAVFAPLSRLRLIVIDEEHDASYKQDETPRYHAREVARYRARSEGAVLVLGSATPSVESYTKAVSAGQFELVRLQRRVLDRSLPAAEIVDMQEEFQRHGPTHIISSRLQSAIERRIRHDQQVMLLLNRRGFAPVFLCRSCGFILRCDHCSVPLTFHRQEQRMICHHCDRAKTVPSRCPECAGPYLYYLGEGTEKLQEIIEKLFPQVRVARMDSDTTSAKGSYFRILKSFGEGATQILIGTQMIAKGHDFPRVTLVGVVAADQGLALPDYRAAERTFQLLTQVAGRSGRGESSGEVILQTRFPNHYSLKFACLQDYEGFYAQEIEFRRSMVYPPFAYLASLIIKGPSLEKVVRESGRVGKALHELRRETGLEPRILLLGPNPAPLERVKGNYRYQILVKSFAREELRQYLKSGLERLEKTRFPSGCLTLDLDPLSLL